MDVPALRGLAEEPRRQLMEGALRRRFKRAEVVFHEGDPANSMHVIVSGHVSVRVTTPLGDEAVFAVLGPGASFGELGLLTETPLRTATVTALDAVETLALSASRLAQVRRADAGLDRFLVSLLAGYLKRQDARLVEALYVPVEKRVLRRLVALTRMYGQGAPGTVIPLTQEIIASIAGSTRPTTNQVLRAAEKSGYITIGRGRIRVDDPAGLARQAR